LFLNAQPDFVSAVKMGSEKLSDPLDNHPGAYPRRDNKRRGYEQVVE